LLFTTTLVTPSARRTAPTPGKNAEMGMFKECVVQEESHPEAERLMERRESGDPET
jgi:hypothetical protein